MLIDSHCHLNMLDCTPFDGKLENVLKAAHDLGVSHFLNVAIKEADFDVLRLIAEQFAEVYCSVGLHPTEDEQRAFDYDFAKQCALHPKVIAIGETGLDYFHCKGDLTWQHERFIAQIKLAGELNKPIIVHSRDAKEDTLRILKEHAYSQGVRGVMHCFTEDWDMAQRAIDLGFYISFSGIVTFKNAKTLQDVAQRCPLNKMLVETDSPYLAPVPKRGKPNTPGYVRYVAEFIAKLRGDSVDNIAKSTTQNFSDLFSVTL